MQEQFNLQSNLHDAARAYAMAGYPVFPIRANSKRPASPNGFKDATTDLAKIDEWWATEPYNIGCCPGDLDLAVIDIEHDGADAFRALHNGSGFPQTYTVATPHGGQHLWFHGELPSLVRPFGPDAAIDTRGKGGYVLMVPSVVDGVAYTVTNDIDIEPLPEWFAAKLKGRAKVAAPTTGIGLDEPQNIQRAVTVLTGYVKRGDVSVEGRGGDDRLYKLAAELRELGIGPEMSVDLIEEHWNGHCSPPWSTDTLIEKCQNAARYAQNEPGASAVTTTLEAFGPALDKLPKAEVQRDRRSYFHAEDDDEMDTTPEATWLVPGVVGKATTVMVYGPTQSYKSFIALDIALAVATGQKTFGVTPTETGPVYYAALEGRADIKRKRRVAWRLAHEIKGRTKFYVMPAPLISDSGQREEFEAEITRRTHLLKTTPALIVIDTVSKSMVGYDSTKDADKFVAYCDHLVHAFGCSVIAIHHSGHDVNKGPRDSSVYRAGFDSVLQVTSPAKKQCEVRVIKFKDTEEPDAPFQFEANIVGPSLVFQPAAIKPAPKVDDITDDMLTEALTRIGALTPADAVDTKTLATVLAPQLPSDTPEVLASGIRKMQMRLGRQAKEHLKPWTHTSGKVTMWCLR